MLSVLGEDWIKVKSTVRPLPLPQTCLAELEPAVANFVQRPMMLGLMGGHCVFKSSTTPYPGLGDSILIKASGSLGTNAKHSCTYSFIHPINRYVSSM